MNHSEVPFEEVLERLPIGIVALKQLDVVYVNPALRAMFGYSSLESVPRSQFLEIVLPTVKTFLENRRSPEYTQSERFALEARGYCFNGTSIDTEVVGIFVHGAELYDALLVVRDITEQKMEAREQALWIKEREYLSTIDRALLNERTLEAILPIIAQHACTLLHAHWVGIVVVDAHAHVACWKSVVGNTTLFPSKPFLLTGPWNHILWSSEIQFCTKDHSGALCVLKDIPEIVNEMLLSLAVVPLRNDNVPKGCFFVGYRDHHEFSGRDTRILLTLAEKILLAILNVQLYDELTHREKELEKLAGIRIHAQEEERRKIARELHDTLGQLLTAIKFNVELLEDTLQPTLEQRERIDDMKRLLDNVMQATRELSYNLMPSVLEDFGLLPAIQVLCDQVSQRTGYSITVHTHGVTERLPSEWEIGLYRIVQESLIVFQKYTGRYEIDIQLINSPESFKVIIDGSRKDTNVEDMTRDKDVAIDVVSIRERATLMGGNFSADVSYPSNITLSVEIPHQQQKEPCNGEDNNSRC